MSYHVHREVCAARDQGQDTKRRRSSKTILATAVVVGKQYRAARGDWDVRILLWDKPLKPRFVRRSDRLKWTPLDPSHMILALQIAVCSVDPLPQAEMNAYNRTLEILFTSSLRSLFPLFSMIPERLPIVSTWTEVVHCITLAVPYYYHHVSTAQLACCEAGGRQVSASSSPYYPFRGEERRTSTTTSRTRCCCESPATQNFGPAMPTITALRLDARYVLLLRPLRHQTSN